MSTEGRSTALTIVSAAAVLIAAPALVQTTHVTASGATDSRTCRLLTTSEASCPAAALDLLAMRQALLDARTDYSAYPGGAAGDSNGHLSAAQQGEPVGAGGTSGGSQGRKP